MSAVLPGSSSRRWQTPSSLCWRRFPDSPAEVMARCSTSKLYRAPRSKRFQAGMLRVLASFTYWPPVRSMRAFSATPCSPGTSSQRPGCTGIWAHRLLDCHHWRRFWCLSTPVSITVAPVFPVVLAGAVILIVAALRTGCRKKQSILLLVLMCTALFACQGLAVLTGLASGKTAAEGSAVLCGVRINDTV